MKMESLARLAHEVNRIYCRSLGDFSQPSWEQAPEWQKESARKGVQGIVAKNVTSPEDSHRQWLRHKRAEGWRYGPDKDPDKKLHPCMVPYEDLPLDQRIKDELFFTVVTTVVDIYHEEPYSLRPPHGPVDG